MRTSIIEELMRELLEDREKCIDQLLLADANDSELVAMGFITSEIAERRNRYAAM